MREEDLAALAAEAIGTIPGGEIITVDIPSDLSVQIDKLTAAGYITVEKGFKGKMPRTTCKMTPAGQEAFGNYVEALKEYLSSGGPGGQRL